MKTLATILLSISTLSGFSATYYTISNSNWSTTRNGSSCGCTPNYATDSLIIEHNRTWIDYQGTTAYIRVEDGGKLTFEVWNVATTLASGVTLDVQDGGRLTIKGNWTNNSNNVTIDGDLKTDYGTFTNNGTITAGTESDLEVKAVNNSGTLTLNGKFDVDYGTLTNTGTIVAGAESEMDVKDVSNSGNFTVQGEFDMGYGTFTNNASGNFTSTSGSDIKMLDVVNNGSFTIGGEFKADKNWNNFTNNGTMLITGSAEVEFGNFSNPGTLTHNGIIEQKKNWNSFNNSGTITGSGLIDLKTNSPSNNGSINGCSNCSFTDPTYLVNVPNNNYVIWYDGDWENGSPSATKSVLIMDDYKKNTDIVCDDLEVKAGAEFELKNNASWTVNGSITNNGTIILSEEAVLVQTDDNAVNSGSGIYQVEREASNTTNEYNIWSSPVSSQHMLEFFTDDNLYDVFTFEASTQSWKYDFATTSPSNSHSYAPFQFGSANLMAGADGVFDIGRGYFAPGKNKKRTFEGTINNGKIYVNVETSDVTTPVSWGGNDWNVIGNPYPSAISATAFLAENYDNGNGVVANAVYYWDDPSQAYITKNNTDADLIGHCQGFWVAATSSGQVEFNNSMRNTSYKDMRSGRPFKATHLTLQSASGASEEIRVYLDDRANDGVDNVYDAYKLENGSGFNFYSLLEGTNYAFQSVRDIAVNEKKTVPVGFTTAETGLFELNIDSLVNMPEHYRVYVEDVVKNITFDLRTKGTFYVQIDSAGTYNDRFFLHIIREEEKPTGNGQDTTITDTTNVANGLAELAVQEGVNVYSRSESEWVVAFEQPNEVIESIEIVDLGGRVVAMQTVNYGTQQEVIYADGMQTGVYIARLIATDGSFTAVKVYHP